MKDMLKIFMNAVLLLNVINVNKFLNGKDELGFKAKNLHEVDSNYECANVRKPLIGKEISKDMIKMFMKPILIMNMIHGRKLLHQKMR